jgi:hypothetical protein
VPVINSWLFKENRKLFVAIHIVKLRLVKTSGKVVEKNIKVCEIRSNRRMKGRAKSSFEIYSTDVTLLVSKAEG